MLAVTQVLLTLLQSGDRVVGLSSVYNWTDTFLLEEAPKFDIQTVQVDMRDTQVLQSDGRGGQYISLPGASVPTYNLEVDVVVHSATKFLCGHSGSLSGIVISNNAEFVAKLRKAPKSMEACSVRLTFSCSPRHRNPPDASKTTLHQRTGDSGVLAQRPAVTEVRYPGLSGDHAHKTVKDLLAGSVGLVDFVVAGDQEVIRYFQKLRGIYATPGRCEHAGLLPKSRAARRYP
jgi:cystathionine beta-lyase/cystathionine gamma-synthase